MVLKIFRVVALILIVALLGVVSVNMFAYASDNDNRAIVVVHGLLGGGLVDASGKPMWDPFGGLDFKSFLSDPFAMVLEILFGQEYSERTSELFDGIINNDPNNLIYQLTSDEDGRVKNNGIVAGGPESSVPFGPFNAYKGIYDGLYNEFNADIDVVMFQYDWRQDNRISAQNLEDFINEKGYDEVIICAHSMGNVVTASYLSKKENRDKVRGYMAMAGPFLGATTALTILEDPNYYINGITDIINDSPILKSMLANKLDTIINDQILPLIFNIATAGQLLPSIEFAKALKEYYGELFLTVDGQEITTNTQLIDFYKSRPWAMKTNGQLRAFINDLDVFMDAMYVEVDGVRYHSSELVNTHYFAGTGLETVVGAKIENSALTEMISAPLGDDIVPLYSATLGKDPALYPNVKIYQGKSHMDIGMVYEGQFAADLSAAIRYLL